MLPQFQTYGKYSSSNYGAHALQFRDATGNVYWFSYSTLVAFMAVGHNRVVRENDWGPTTGKHLNWIDGGAKDRRIPGEQFERLFKARLAA